MPLSDEQFLGGTEGVPAPSQTGAPPQQPPPVSQGMSDEAFLSGAPSVQGVTAPAGSLPAQPEKQETDRSWAYDQLAKGGSSVKWALDKLTIPLNIETGLAVKALDAIGVDGIEKALNPNKDWMPSINYADMTEYLADRYAPPEKLFQWLQDNNYSPEMSGAVMAGYKTATAGIGLAANLYADPLMLLSVFTKTPEALELYKQGIYTDKSRNLIELHTPPVWPFDGKAFASVPLAPITNAASKVAGAVKDNAAYQGAVGLAGKVAASAARASEGLKARSPDYKWVAGKIGKLADGTFATPSRMREALNYKTGDPNVDLRVGVHAGAVRGDMQALHEDYAAPWFENKFAKAEKTAVSRLVENTANVEANVPESVVNAAGKKLIQPKEQVRAEMVRQFDSLTGDLGLKLPPGRREAMIDQAMQIKKANAEVIENRFRIGKLDEKNAGTWIRENYLAREADPAKLREMKAQKISDLTGVPTTADEVRASKQILGNQSGRPVSAFDTGQFKRKSVGGIEAATAAKEAETGLKDFYIQDPMVTTMAKVAESRRLVRDKQLIDFLAERHGLEKNHPYAVANGYVGIPIKEFEGARVRLMQGSNVMRDFKVGDVVFPPKLADKLTYYMTPRKVGFFPGFLDSYNRVFRTVKLANPGYYNRNWVENMLKNWTQGVKLEDYADMKAILFDKSAKVMVGGRQYDAPQLYKMMRDSGVFSGGQFREGLADAINSGKSMMPGWKDMSSMGGIAKGMTKVRSAQDIIQGLREMGEGGENFTRGTLFLRKLKEGFTPETALLEVEKYLFDFSRNSKFVDQYARRIAFPFIQHALKTAHVTPSILAKSSGIINFAHNSYMQTLANAMNDPVSQAAIHKILPEYKQWEDPVAGPYLPANSYLAAAFLARAPGQPPPSGVIMFKAAFGTDILRNFMYLDSQMAKRGFGVSPLIKSVVSMVAGHDVFNDKQIDADLNHPSGPRRVAFAINTAFTGALDMPNVHKMINNVFGLTDPEHIEPNSLLLLKAAFGQGMDVVNLDKEFLFKAMTLAKMRRPLVNELRSALRAEMQGKTADMSLDDKPQALKDMYEIGRKYPSSLQAYKSLVGDAIDTQGSRAALEFLGGKKSAQEYAGIIRNLDQTIKDLNHNYQVVRSESFKSRAEGIEAQKQKAAKALSDDEFLGGRSPQSVGDNSLPEKYLRPQDDTGEAFTTGEIASMSRQEVISRIAELHDLFGARYPQLNSMSERKELQIVDTLFTEMDRKGIDPETGERYSTDRDTSGEQRRQGEDFQAPEEAAQKQREAAKAAAEAPQRKYHISVERSVNKASPTGHSLSIKQVYDKD